MNPFRLNQRGAIDLILIGVFLVLAAGLGGYVYYQQQQAQKTYDASGKGVTVTKQPAEKARVLAEPSFADYVGWKTYTNDQYKFSFRYPSDWKLLVVEQAGNTTTLEIYSAFSPVVNAGGFSLYRSRESLAEEVNSEIKQCSPANCKIVSQEKVEKSGAAGVVINMENTTNNLAWKTYIFNTGEFTYAARGIDEEQVGIIAEKVFNSLTFIK